MYISPNLKHFKFNSASAKNQLLGYSENNDIDCSGWAQTFYDYSNFSGFIKYLEIKKIKCYYLDLNSFMTWLNHQQTPVEENFKKLFNYNFEDNNFLDYKFIISHLGEGLSFTPTLRASELLTLCGVPKSNIYHMLSCKEEKYSNIKSVSFWEFFIRPPFIAKTSNSSIIELCKNKFENLVPNKHFICLMRRLKLDRLNVYSEIQKYSWAQSNTNIDISLGTVWGDGNDELLGDILGRNTTLFRDNIQNKLPITWDREYVDCDEQHELITSKPFNQIVNVIVETFISTSNSCYGSGFITEKSLKPFALYQLPLFIGQKGLVANIRDLGFDVFDDIFDGHSYDNIENPHVRTAEVVKLMDKFYNQYPHNKLGELKQSLLPRLNNNLSVLSKYTLINNYNLFKEKAIKLINQ